MRSFDRVHGWPYQTEGGCLTLLCVCPPVDVGEVEVCESAGKEVSLYMQSDGQA